MYFKGKKHMCSYSDNSLCVMMLYKGLVFSDWISGSTSWFSFGPSERTPFLLLCWTEEAGNTQVINHWWIPKPLVEAGVGPRGCWWFVWLQWQWGYVPRVAFCRVNNPRPPPRWFSPDLGHFPIAPPHSTNLPTVIFFIGPRVGLPAFLSTSLLWF